MVFIVLSKMKRYTFTPDRQVCSRTIEVNISPEGKIVSVHFEGGCPGSLKAVAVLVKGKTPEEAIKLLSGITCGSKKTSCPDQLAKALKKFVF